MDPFNERDLIICLKAISSTLNNMDARLEELVTAVREVSLGIEVDEEVEKEIVDPEEKGSFKDEDIAEEEELDEEEVL